MNHKLAQALFSLMLLFYSCQGLAQAKDLTLPTGKQTDHRDTPEVKRHQATVQQQREAGEPRLMLLPNPKPFMESAGASRQDPIFMVRDFSYHSAGSNEGTFHEQPSFIVGNKAVVVRRIDGEDRPDEDRSVTLYINNKQVGRFMWWGSFNGGGFGYPFKEIPGDPASLKIDQQAKVVVYTKPYRTPEGKRAVFTYILRGLKSSKISLSWDMGVSQAELENSKEDFSAQLWFSAQNYRGKQITIGDQKFKEATREELIRSKNVTTVTSGHFVYNASVPLEGYRLALSDLGGQITESIYAANGVNDRYDFLYRTHAPKRQVSRTIIIDLGEAALPQKNTPPAIGGIDFWKMDGIHVPLSPTRNIMLNPSFEKGLRFWKWIGGGATYTPDTSPRTDIVPEGRFGKSALILRNTHPGSPGIKSFPMSLEKGQAYTLSFYAKAAEGCELTVSLSSAAQGGAFKGKNGPWGDTWNPESKFSITTAWKRYFRTFTADAAGVSVCLLGSHDTRIDGFQLEKGDTPTEFVCAPIDGNFTTADKDNSIVKGKPIDAGFTFTGKPGTSGAVAISAKNAFREIVYSGKFNIKIGPDGIQKISLPFDAVLFGEGLFVIRTDCNVTGFKPYSDYYRFSIMTPLRNTHPTKNIFGTLGHYDRVSRGEDLAKKYMEWGFGSTSWGYGKGGAKLRPFLEKKYRIANIATLIINEDREIGSSFRDWKSVTPEMEKKIEKVAFEAATVRDPELYSTWAFGNEEEGAGLIRDRNFDEYFKAQYATAKGVTRAMPHAQILPTCGTSGYSRMRGYDAIEGYLKAAQKHNFKYGGIAVHPYGNIDMGTLSQNDLDEETARLIAQMKRYGYGKETPIYYTEMFNTSDVYIPNWGAGESYDSYQAGKPTYDFGNREFIHAASASRAYIIMLKYWPHVQSGNIWTSRPFMDLHLTPLILCKAVNTLGTHFGDVKYRADIKPSPGVRGYAFELKDGTGIAPVWCVSHDVENGLTRGPELEVKFGQPVTFIDLMGNPRSAKTDRNGITTVQLTPAPLLIKAKDVDRLANALQNAISNDTSSPIRVTCFPDSNGNITIRAKNLTGRFQSGNTAVKGETLNHTSAYKINPGKSEDIAVFESKQGKQFGTMYKWENRILIAPSKGERFEKSWKMDYFYVPKVEGKPNWNNVPSLPLANHYQGSYSVLRTDGKGRDVVSPDVGQAGDLKADFKMAWDKDNLYLRIEVEDDNFLAFPKLWENGNAYKLLYEHDGCLEVYFDTGADGRINDAKTYDNNDYRYDFSIGRSGKSGSGMVYRLREVYHQLADGINMASKEEAAQKIKCDFKRTANGYAYTITFGQRYLEPIVLKKGFIAGFGLFLHDRDDASLPAGIKGLSLATESGSHCDYKPHLWPLMILAD